MMTLAHLVYIPGILLLGVVIGWVLGARAAELARRDAGEREDAAQARERARAARARARSAAAARAEDLGEGGSGVSNAAESRDAPPS